MNSIAVRIGVRGSKTRGGVFLKKHTAPRLYSNHPTRRGLEGGGEAPLWCLL
jgi:hypothetical protein